MHRIGRERQIAASYSGKHSLIAFSEGKVVGARLRKKHITSQLCQTKEVGRAGPDLEEG